MLGILPFIVLTGWGHNKNYIKKTRKPETTQHKKSRQNESHITNLIKNVNTNETYKNRVKSSYIDKHNEERGIILEDMDGDSKIDLVSVFYSEPRWDHSNIRREMFKFSYMVENGKIVSKTGQVLEKTYLGSHLEKSKDYAPFVGEFHVNIKEDVASNWKTLQDYFTKKKKGITKTFDEWGKSKKFFEKY